ncbi:MAG: lipopolysaccharide assembly protein LapA domain-containing protein [Mycobacterium sp.]|jgi:uncharacterized integral membrane protein|nr:lipopolysaccharide assembly protein LapA domain-containing protein [Mycobacterium sp.]
MNSDPLTPDQPSPAAAEAGTANLPEPTHPSDVKFTRAAALWSSLILGFLVLIVLLIFIAQNTASASFAFLSWRWDLPLGVAILFAAVCGGLITALVSAARMFQLRRVAKKNLEAALKR